MDYLSKEHTLNKQSDLLNVTSDFLLQKLSQHQWEDDYEASTKYYQPCLQCEAWYTSPIHCQGCQNFSKGGELALSLLGQIGWKPL